MEHQGFMSLIPVILAIVAAVVTRKVILSLFLGVYVGVLIVVGGNPIEATTRVPRFGSHRIRLDFSGRR